METPEVVDIKTLISEKKEQIAEMKSAFRKFKKAHGIRTIEKVKDEKLVKEFNEHQDAIEAAQKELDELNSQKPAKGSGGSRGSYNYGKVMDPETKELRETTKAEQKKWRTQARRKAKADGVEPQTLDWDPNFLMPKPKAEKPKKEKEEAKAPEETGDKVTQEEKTKKVKKVKKDLD